MKALSEVTLPLFYHDLAAYPLTNTSKVSHSPSQYLLSVTTKTNSDKKKINTQLNGLYKCELPCGHQYVLLQYSG